MTTSASTLGARVLGFASCAFVVGVGLGPGVAGLITHPEAKRQTAFWITIGLLGAATVGYVLAWFAQRAGGLVLLVGAGTFALCSLYSRPFRFAWFGPVVVEVPMAIAAVLVLSGALFLYGARTRSGMQPI